MLNLTEFHFIRPYYLSALIPALAILFFLLKNKLNRGNWSTVCDSALLPFILQEKSVHKSRWTLSLTSIASLLAIIALAGPSWERLPSPVFRNDAALVIALDLSRSMDANDIKPSRLSRARFKIADILKQRKDGQTALLVYAGDAFTVTPLTEDNETISSQLSALTTEIMPASGSNTELAINKSIALLKQAGLQSGEILLVTDGIDLDSLDSTINTLKTYDLSVLGVGTPEGAPIKESNGGFLKDKLGNIVVPKLNSSELSQLANRGGGIYQTITGDNHDIDALLNRFDDPVEKQGNENNNLLIEQWDEKGPWLLLLVLPLAALSFRKGLMVVLVCLLPFPEPSYALEWNDLWKTQNQQAQQAFKNENYQQAAEQFDDTQWKAAAQHKANQFDQVIQTLENDQSSIGQYNLGNALALSGKLPEAIKAYDKALQINPADEDAKYNKEQVEKQLEKQQQKQQSDQQQKSDQQDSEKGDKEQDEQDNQDSDSKPSDEQNDQQQSEPEQSDQQQDDKGSKSEQPEQAEQKPESEQDQQQAPMPSEYDESEQANEQWLNRIPDDPAGLLRRKFKYQYKQRDNKSSNSQAW